MHPDTAVRRGLTPDAPADLTLFAGDDWLIPGPETSCHELTVRACGAAGFVPRPAAVASDFSVLTALVAAGAGVTLLPRMALPDGVAGVAVHPLAAPVGRTVSALTRTGDARVPQVRRVVDALRAAAEQAGS